MKEHPILFSAPMVREILAGRKTVTRRIIRQMLCEGHGGPDRAALRAFDQSTGVATFGDAIPDDPCPVQVKCPYGVPGDRLWVRETHCRDDSTVYFYRADEDAPECACPCDLSTGGYPEHCRYHPGCEGCYPSAIRWTPSIHMPRWASRITLEITDVRVERLQEITEEDCIAEGTGLAKIQDARDPCRGPLIDGFANAWDRINGKRAPWAINPWVWVVAFRQLEAERD